jgi:hypothetical protein
MKNGSGPANDPSFDPVITLIMRYMRQFAIVGMVFALFAIGWAMSL